MNCNIVKDLIPLYIDGCCSKESQAAVTEHIQSCEACAKLLNDMKAPSQIAPEANAPKVFRKLNDWKASVLQSVLLFLSFALITIGVALEAKTPLGIGNGFWAVNLVIPATGFMLSLANWYFVSVYKSRKRFSNCSLIVTAAITVAAYTWAGFHYELNLVALLAGNDVIGALEILYALSLWAGIGILLSAVFCTLSKLLSGQYAKMLGKE